MGKKFLAVLAAIATLAVVPQIHTSMTAPSVDSALWNAPAAVHKGQGRGGRNGKSPANRTQAHPLDSQGGGGGGKGQNRSKSQGKRSNLTQGDQAIGSGGYHIGDSKRPRLPTDSYPFGTGALEQDIALLSSGSPYPGIAKQEDHGAGALPTVFEWIPCLNNRCSAPSRNKPPYSRAGISNFAAVSNPKVKCKFCLVEYLPAHSQRIIEVFQRPLVSKLGGALGPLHPKFKGSKLYSQAEYIVAMNEGTEEAGKPPVFDVSAGLFDSRPCPLQPQPGSTAPAPMGVGQWLNANRSPKPLSSAEAVQSAQASKEPSLVVR